MAEKTNVMRILEKAGVEFSAYTYKSDGQVDGVHVAETCGIPFEKCFKTLVTFYKENSGKTAFFVFVIPVKEELDLKASAKSVGVKRVEMLAVKDLLKTTGYIRGGCSPVGMKKTFTTVIDSSAEAQDWITVSGGKIGTQIRLSPLDLVKVVNGKFDKITV